ncbi:hypothetical protein TRFO_22021 [Tritrichomonas foetus]|uniref:Uncharacterized protein n=1 Tax=Tritrichomonas foetus TaxID=1144522 RepID=A0A1J4KCP1_9EUKA|nr:hypothetical protein TRFO_22021 [Tritrichomonas foetus]|eukprot:OHT09191.1 hypothetical protein TRFO_22021 [Tritrichomonas foetus]
MTKTGRPVFHIKAQWISIDGPDGSVYYKLDNKGRLMKQNGKLAPSFCIGQMPNELREISNDANQRVQSSKKNISESGEVKSEKVINKALNDQKHISHDSDLLNNSKRPPNVETSIDNGNLADPISEEEFFNNAAFITDYGGPFDQDEDLIFDFFDLEADF